MRLPTFQLNTLQWALGVSLGLHAVLLTVRFVAPEALERAFRDTPGDDAHPRMVKRRR